MESKLLGLLVIVGSVSAFNVDVRTEASSR